jgi:hypothetical protein
MAQTKQVAVEAADGWYVETWDYSYDPPKVIGNDGPYELSKLPNVDFFQEDLAEDLA